MGVGAGGGGRAHPVTKRIKIAVAKTVLELNESLLRGYGAGTTGKNHKSPNERCARLFTSAPGGAVAGPA